MKYKTIHHTPFGPIFIVWEFFKNQSKVKRILLSNPKYSADAYLKQKYGAITLDSCPLIEDLSHKLVLFLEGQTIHFSLNNISLEDCPPFQKQVLRTEYQIPRGQVSTYQLIGQHLGKPKAARAVGNALATNPFPIIIPCHRAIRKDLSLGGYQGGLKMKRILLEQEGIPFDNKERVIIDQFHYQ